MSKKIPPEGTCKPLESTILSSPLSVYPMLMN
jgi:hypothetical protein